MTAIIQRSGLPTMESFLKDFFGTSPFLNERFNYNFSGDVNLSENDNSYELSMVLPGYKKDNISLEISDDVLTVKSEISEEKENEGKNYIRKEYSRKSFEKQFILPDNVDKDNINAKMEDGILNIEISKIKEIKSDVVKKIDIH